MAKYGWMSDEIIDSVKDLIDKLTDVDIAIENVVDTIKYDVEDYEDTEVEEIMDDLSWDFSGSIGELINRLEDLFEVEL